MHRPSTTALLACLVLLGLSLPAQAATGGTPGGLAGVTYAVKGTPPDGFTQLSFPITVLDNADPKASWFWADQIEFADKTAAYMGLQPNGDKGRTALFSVFGAGTTAQATTCKAGADASSGTSCHRAYPWKTGTTYVFTIYLASRGSSERWVGTVTDSTSKATVTLGAWSVPNSRGLIKPAIGFSEYFSKVSSCSALPQMSVRFDAPTASIANNRIAGTVTKAYGYGSTGKGYIDCRKVAHTSKTSTTALVQAPGTAAVKPPTAPAPTVAPTHAVPVTSGAPSKAPVSPRTSAAGTSSLPPVVVDPVVPLTSDQPVFAPESPAALPVAQASHTSAARNALPIAGGILVLALMVGLPIAKLYGKRERTS